jgi:hypothetical protein
MKRILLAVLAAVVMATPAVAANVYLKDGGVIKAKRVWRSGGKVHVLATRHTLTSFEPSEVNLKRTFPKRHRAVRKVAAVPPQAPSAAAAPNGAPATQTPEPGKKLTLPSLPKLPEKSPESLVPKSGDGGVIRKYNKEKAERIGE